MSDITSTMRASRMYNNAKAIASGKVDLEVSWATIGGILLLGFLYMITASVGISVFSKCDAMKGKSVQENLNKYLAATLTIALTIPFWVSIRDLMPRVAVGYFFLAAIIANVAQITAAFRTLGIIV